MRMHPHLCSQECCALLRAYAVAALAPELQRHLRPRVPRLQPYRLRACPVSTGGGTRRVRLVREGGGEGGGGGARAAPPAVASARPHAPAPARREARGGARLRSFDSRARLGEGACLVPRGLQLRAPHGRLRGPGGARPAGVHLCRYSKVTFPKVNLAGHRRCWAAAGRARGPRRGRREARASPPPPLWPFPLRVPLPVGAFDQVAGSRRTRGGGGEGAGGRGLDRDGGFSAWPSSSKTRT